MTDKEDRVQGRGVVLLVTRDPIWPSSELFVHGRIKPEIVFPKPSLAAFRRIELTFIPDSDHALKDTKTVVCNH